MSVDKTKEPQYQSQLEWRDEHSYSRFGLQTGYTWENDPRHFYLPCLDISSLPRGLVDLRQS